MKYSSIISVGSFRMIMLTIVLGVFCGCVVLAEDPIPGLTQPHSESAKPSNQELLTNEGAIKYHQENVDNHSRCIQVRIESSEWLMKMGVTDGLQAILPVIGSLYQGEVSREDQQKILDDYLETIDPEIVKKQVLELITSGNERIENREAGVALSILMKNYFASDEVRALIDNEDNPRMKGALIAWLDYVGDASDYPSPVDAIYRNDERAIQASIEFRQEEVDNSSRLMDFRVRNSEWLMEMGVTDGLQVVLPIIDKLVRIRSLKEKQKMIADYLETVDPEIVKKQVLKIITSDKEHKATRLGAINLATCMSKYFTSNEVKALIDKESDQEIKSSLISLLGYIGDISDFPYLIMIADISPEQYGKVEEKAVNTLSFMSAIQHWPDDPPGRRIQADNPPEYIQFIVNQWKSWWEKVSDQEVDEQK